MEVISKKENRIYLLIMLFPVLYLWTAILLKNSGMRIFYFTYSTLIIFWYSKKKQYTFRKNIVLSFFLVLIKLVYDFLVYPNSASDAILLGFFYLYLTMFPEKSFRKKYLLFLKYNERKVLIAYVVYMLGILITLLNGTGYTNTWGTFSIQGPYGLAHILAYELLVMAINSYLLCIYTGHKYWWIFFGTFMGIIALTTVRTVLLCVAIMVAFWFVAKKGLKKFLYAVGGVGAVFFAIRFTSLFTYVLEKTVNAVANGSITNYRFEIWTSSLNCFNSATALEKLLGQGIVALQEWNLFYMNMKIQAHNDFFTVLVSFGIVSLIIYIYKVLKLAKGPGAIGFVFCLLALIMYNGLYSYCSFVIGLISVRLFFETININQNDVCVAVNSGEQDAKID